MQRIGVFVCHCGSNIAATVDVKKVVEVISQEPGVVHAEDYQYMCSEAGQEKIIQAIREKELTGVVVCSCSPRMHEATFRKAVAKAGLNPYMLEVANIREQCSWIHKDMEEATKKAVILARAAVAKVNLDAPLQEGESRVTKRALVIGGGIAGIQSALDIADAGYEVDIVEKTPSIGGRMSQLDKTFPTLDCSACILTPKMVEANAHEKIHIYTYSEVEKISGFVGDFTVEIRKKARSVDMSKCTGCGVCQEKCPSKRSPAASTEVSETVRPSTLPSPRPSRMFLSSTVRIVSNLRPENVASAPRSARPEPSTTTRRMRSSVRSTEPSLWPPVSTRSSWISTMSTLTARVKMSSRPWSLSVS